MSKIQSVCVYCGASSGIDDVYKNSAKELGTKLAANGIHMVFGGGATGMMGMTADAALSTGGQVTGIFPSFLERFELPHKGVTKMHIVESMHERKQMMAELSDCFVVMPGGFGTLDEFFEILTWRQLQLHNKPVFLVNINGYWTPLLDTLAHIFEQKFAREIHRDCFAVANTVDALIHNLKTVSGGQKLSTSCT